MGLFKQAAGRRLFSFAILTWWCGAWQANEATLVSFEGDWARMNFLCDVRKFAKYIRRSTDKATEADLRRYLLYIKNERNFTPSSINAAYSAIKFFDSKTCERTWSTHRNPVWIFPSEGKDHDDNK